MNKNEIALHAYKARKHALTGIYNAQSGHPGGSLSICDILSVLYFEVMNVDPKNPKMEDRDRFVLSKGHCAPALYAILAEKGFFPVEDVYTLRRTDSYIQGHPDMKGIPGVDMSTGMALAGKLSDKDYRVYSILGDGELEEGQVWEAAMFAAHYKLDNLTAFVDYNGLQIDGKITDVMNSEPIDDKFRAFGWNVVVIDAHNYDAILDAINEAKETKGKPTLVLAKSVKGKGVSFMEGSPAWHGAAPNAEQFEQAIAELDATIKGLEA